MKYRLKYKDKKVNEDDIQEPQNTETQNDTQQSDADKAKAEATNKQIAELLNKKLQKKTQYQTDIKNIENQIVALQKQKAELGEDVDVDCIDNESMNPYYRFGRNLFESVTNRTDEMFAIISLAFDSIPSLSYRPNDTRCRTYAKNIISFLNRNEWKTDNHGEEFKDFISGLLNASHISLSTREKEVFIEKFSELIKENAMFSWVFIDR